MFFGQLLLMRISIDTCLIHSIAKCTTYWTIHNSSEILDWFIELYIWNHSTTKKSTRKRNSDLVVVLCTKMSKQSLEIRTQNEPIFKKSSEIIKKNFYLTKKRELVTINCLSSRSLVYVYVFFFLFSNI